MEQSFLAWLKGRSSDLPRVAVGIGDDAAILHWPPGAWPPGAWPPGAWPPGAAREGQREGQQLVIATDQVADGVDFLLAEHPLPAIGRKAVLVNLSDMAAMAAEPIAILVTLSLPREGSTQIAAGIYDGILAVAKEYGLAIAGGDITIYDGPVAVSVTILGAVPSGGGWLRSGAREGDAIVVTGAVGGSILGRHLEPEPRVRQARRIAESVDVHAAIDISDGLSLDLDRLCAASGVGAEMDLEAIPIHADAVKLASRDSASPLEHAWGDGEDFELILAVAPQSVAALLKQDFGVPLTQIGTFTGRTGLWARRGGHLERMSPRGFIHGRR
ncbi:thiamine-phosphate kinase [Candidatus Laterigemmans baculatus]|uniref:thiamine-phosphate kinase n=1 Tax=Candidatus Laterigemmans baculatus TaxID=2770505 RepID=UPI0013DAC013|nr:thiamine-phosphate kinase [Candidatus Laterigemmans baculatus]